MASGIKFDKCYEHLGPVPISRCRLTSIGIPMIKIKLSYGRLIFITLKIIPGKTVFILKRRLAVVQVQRRWRTVRFCEFLESSLLTTSAKKSGWAMIHISIINSCCYEQVNFLRELEMGPVGRRSRNTCILRD